jgi:hypothetical protein
MVRERDRGRESECETGRGQMRDGVKCGVNPGTCAAHDMADNVYLRQEVQGIKR